MIFAPVGAVPGVAFVGTDTGTLAALDTRTGERSCGRTRRPTRRAAARRSSTARVLWGYGFTLFGGPGEGGVISFDGGPEQRVTAARAAPRSRSRRSCCSARAPRAATPAAHDRRRAVEHDGDVAAATRRRRPAAGADADRARGRRTGR